LCRFSSFVPSMIWKYPIFLPFLFPDALDDWIASSSQLISLFHQALSGSLIEPIPADHCITFSSERPALDFRMTDRTRLASRTSRTSRTLWA
jgi:hypothetical protein